MPFPKLTTLQARFAASFTAALLLFVLYLIFSNPHYAYAADPDSLTRGDHNHPLILQLGEETEVQLSIQHDTSDDHIAGYEPDFLGVGRDIIGRAPSPVTQTLQNNVPAIMTIMPGELQNFVFPASALSTALSSPTPAIPPNQIVVDTSAGPATEPNLYLTLSICAQPLATEDHPSGLPAPLDLYVSYSSINNQSPGPGSSMQQQGVVSTNQGFVNYTEHTSGDTYFGVLAPSNAGFSGNYTYQLTASNDEPYTYAQDFQSLYFLDSDSDSGLFVTNNLTTSESAAQQWLSAGTPFGIFVHNQDDISIQGLLRSYCGLNNSAQIKASVDVEMGLNTVAGGYPKQQFYVPGLNKSSSYHAILALDSQYQQSGPGNPGGGGMLWQDINFTTKSGTNSNIRGCYLLTCIDGNCRLIYNLEFCDTVSYAVPSNSTNYPSMSSLASVYDNYTSQAFMNFTYSLEQIPCDTTGEAQYSLATNCSNCSTSYKQWLCAVTIPRCTDFSSIEPYLQPRSVVNSLVWYENSSRVPNIDNKVMPGPYKELLPCVGLCYGIMQNCPALLGFACPLAGKGQNHSYGYVTNITNGGPTCNIPGAYWGVSGASGHSPYFMTVWTFIFVTTGLSIMLF